jgi:hypothetical protein
VNKQEKQWATLQAEVRGTLAEMKRLQAEIIEIDAGISQTIWERRVERSYDELLAACSSALHELGMPQHEQRPDLIIPQLSRVLDRAILVSSEMKGRRLEDGKAE